MEKTSFDYSMNNIPLPTRKAYLKKLIEKTESVIRRMRWKAFFFEKSTNEDAHTTNTSKNFPFKSKKCPPQINELANFEADLVNIIKNIRFRKMRNEFHGKLRNDINKINKSTKAFIPADKTTNFYELDKNSYNRLLTENVTSSYKKVKDNIALAINNEALRIATDLDIQDSRT